MRVERSEQPEIREARPAAEDVVVLCEVALERGLHVRVGRLGGGDSGPQGQVKFGFLTLPMFAQKAAGFI